MANLLIQMVYEQNKDDVYAYLLSMCHDRSLSEDLTSEVFLSAIGSLPGFRGESDIKTWLFSIARYKWYHHLGKKKRELLPEDFMAAYLGEGPDLEACVLSGELLERIRQLIAGEPEKNRNVVRMRIEGYSFYEIARKYGISESSARVLDFRTKNKIRAILRKEGYTYE